MSDSQGALFISERRLPRPPKRITPLAQEALTYYAKAHDSKGRRAQQRKHFAMLDYTIKCMSPKDLAAYYKQVREWREQNKYCNW